jgi:hypothetical protein
MIHSSDNNLAQWQETNGSVFVLSYQNPKYLSGCYKRHPMAKIKH